MTGPQERVVVEVEWMCCRCERHFTVDLGEMPKGEATKAYRAAQRGDYRTLLVGGKELPGVLCPACSE